MDHRNDEIDLLEILGTLWRAKWLLILMTVLFAAAGYAYTSRVVEKVYSARATVAIENRGQQVTDLENIVSGLSSEQPSLNTEIHVIRSRQLLERLVDERNLLDDPEFNPTLSEPSTFSVAGIRALILGPSERTYTEEQLRNIAIDRVLDRMTVVNPRQSYVFEIGVSADSPAKAAMIANAVAELYIRDQLIIKESMSADAIAYLQERTNELQRNLSESELEVKDFAAATELVSPETLAAKNRQVKELRDRLSELRASITTQTSRVDELRGLSIDEATLEGVIALGVPSLSTAFRGFQNGTLSATALQGVLATAISQAERAVLQNQAQEQSLGEAVAALEAEIETQSQDLLTLQQLEREAEANREIYAYFLNRLKEAEVQQGTHQPDARLLSSAVVPNAPSSPRVMLTAALFGILGGMLASVLAIVRQLRDQGIKNAEDLRNTTEHTVFGEIPVAPIRRRNGLVPFVARNQASAFSEAIRNLRTSLTLSDLTSEPRLILITSSVPGEGKTTMSISLAANLAGLDKKVLLVEVDIRRRTLNEYFDFTGSQSLVDAVEAGAVDPAKVHTNSDLGIDVLPGGKSDRNAADFFSSDRFSGFIKSASEVYDYVILDAPPVMAVPDARIIGKHVDRILFACAWNRTPRAVVRAALTSMESINLKVSGVVLTQIDVNKAKKLGTYGNYGYYGTYGAGYYDA